MLLLVAIVCAFIAPSLASSPISIALCLSTRCTSTLPRCLLSSNCRQTLACMRQCKLDDSICTSRCFFFHSNTEFNELTRCGLEQGCLPRMTWSDLSCPVVPFTPPVLPTLANNFNITDFLRRQQSADWFVARGAHPVFDCFPCQRLTMSKVNLTTQTSTRDLLFVDAEWTTALNQQVRGATYRLASLRRNSSHLWTEYELFGMPVKENYFILAQTYNFILFFYCGAGFGGEYQGAVVYARNMTVELSAETETLFQRALDRAKLQKYVPRLSQFCRPVRSATDCLNYPKSLVQQE